MPLERLALKDFQAHQSLAVDLDPGVTTLVGPNSAGKSTVLRALYALCLGKFKPGHLRHGAEKAAVTLTFDGRVLKAKRGKKNSLHLDEKTYAATRQEVPAEVEQALALGEENFQRQGDAHFWLSLPPGQGAAKLNELVDLSLIDSALSKANGKVTQAKAAVQVSEDRLAKAERTKAETEWAVEADTDLKVLEELDRKVRKLDGEIAALDRLLEEGRAAKEEVDTLSRALEAAEEALEAGEALDAARKEIAALEALLGEMEEALPDAKLVMPDLSAVEEARAAADAAVEEVRTLQYLLEDYDRAVKDLAEAEKEQQDLDGSVCPTCGREV